MNNKGKKLVELVISLGLLAAVVLVYSVWMNQNSSHLLSTFARKETVQTNQVIRAIALRLFRTRRSADGIQVSNADPHLVQFHNDVFRGGAQQTEVTQFQTICESTQNNPILNTAVLNQVPDNICSGVARPACPAGPSRYVVQLQVAGNTVKTYPSELSGVTARSEGGGKFPVASFFCVDTTTNPTANPFVVPEGDDVQITIATGYLRNQTELVWSRTTLLLPVIQRNLTGIEVIDQQ